MKTFLHKYISSPYISCHLYMKFFDKMINVYIYNLNVSLVNPSGINKKGRDSYT